MNKASGGDGIPVELFQILKDDAGKVLHCICQQIWKTQQWPQDWKRSVFIPIPKKGNAKECSNYHTSALISHNSEVMLRESKARGDGIPDGLFQILEDDAVKVLHSICQQIWKTAVATGLEKVSFHSNPKEGQCQGMLKPCTTALNSHAIYY